MASQDADETESAVAQECMPCDGRGTVISRLGGQESVVRCPWCEGSGQRRTGIDAQAHWPTQEGEREAAQPAEQGQSGS